MDKTSMKRATSRTTNRHINKQQQQQSVSGFKKSKKEKLRTLSSMGCNLDHHSNKSISTNNKVFNECNGVDHSSVPRKIRSAMKKRGRESILTDSEKLKYGMESPQKDSIKKSKKQVVLGPITKDEQEVAETLYALAGMFPTNDEDELDCESLPKKLSGTDRDESVNVIDQGATEDANLVAESFSKGEVKVSSLSETVEVEQIDLLGSEDFSVATQNTVAKVNLQGVSMMVKRSENDVKAELHDSELCLGMGLNASTQSEISHIGRKLDVEYETVGGIDCKQEQHIIKYQRKNEGLTLWPGSSLRASTTINAFSSQSSAAAKAPHWLNAAISDSKHGLMESSSSGGKISKTAVLKKSWKSCAAHVHISQLIRRLELPKQQVAKEPELYECDQIRVHQGSKCGVLTEAQNSNRTRNGNALAAVTAQSASLKNFPENKNGVLQQQCHYLDISLSEASPTPAKHAPQSQNFNFLSLSSGCNELKVDECLIKGGSRSGPFSKSQVPYYRSIQQQHGLMAAIPTTSNQYASTSYLDQLPPAGPQVRLQQPHYYGTPLCGTQYSSTNPYKQQHQNIWAAQLVTQGGSGGVNSNLMRLQYPNWQSGRYETGVVNPGVQVMVPYHSLASLESLGSKITSISDQQSFTPPSSIPLSRTNGLEEIRGRFHGSGASSLQLLCDERI